ncbi:DUF4249 domain-containing protein [Microbacter margulisiae]|uniref:DUF4249 domain-containing protein n=1 Tax=Microbacter margulisiae TaxID=1350067 RepID=A0A7W5DS44_9PORP|nr:DUF4249 domain-containing protein [Microbacter margulisiae]MBB3188047.1 hypothetical protein [Microbacter margulisiae]
MNIHKIIHLFLLFLAGILISCQQVIDLKLNTSSSQIVIQGNIYDLTVPDTVHISQSVNFDSTNVFPAVSGAIVTINDNIGNTDSLKEIFPGTYITSFIKGIPGNTYTLQVEIKGKRYSATSTMPYPVAIDSVYFEKSIIENDKQIAVEFTDPANIENFYRIIEFVNQGQLDNFFVTSDQLNDGGKIIYRIWNDNQRLTSGKNITIWLESIDENMYNYFRAAASNGRQIIAPANPVSNISNGALGYFSACSIRNKRIVVP